MFVITHALSPVALIAIADVAVLERTGTRLFRTPHYVAFAISGALPDILHPHLSLAARYSSWTHTAWFLAAFIVIALIAGRLLFDERVRLVTCLLCAACAFHLFCDAISGGIAWAYPYSTHVIGASLVSFSLWPILDLVFITLVVALFAWLHKREHAILDRSLTRIDPEP